MVEIIRRIHNPSPRRGADRDAGRIRQGRDGGAVHWRDEVKANLADAPAARPGARVPLAWVDGEPAGACHPLRGLSTCPVSRCSISTTWRYTPAHRGHGIGKRLAVGRRAACPGAWELQADPGGAGGEQGGPGCLSKRQRLWWVMSLILRWAGPSSGRRSQGERVGKHDLPACL